MTPLSLEPSRAIHALIGWYETEKCWEHTIGQPDPRWVLNDRKNCYLKDMEYVPAPTFADLIRVVDMIV